MNLKHIKGIIESVCGRRDFEGEGDAPHMFRSIR